MWNSSQFVPSVIKNGSLSGERKTVNKHSPVPCSGNSSHSSQYSGTMQGKRNQGKHRHKSNKPTRKPVWRREAFLSLLGFLCCTCSPLTFATNTKTCAGTTHRWEKQLGTHCPFNPKSRTARSPVVSKVSGKTLLNVV